MATMSFVDTINNSSVAAFVITKIFARAGKAGLRKRSRLRILLPCSCSYSHVRKANKSAIFWLPEIGSQEALGLGPWARGSKRAQIHTHTLGLAQQDDQNTLGQFCGELTDVEHLKMNLRHDSIGNNGTSKKRLAKENLLDSGCTCLRNSGSFAGSPP